MITKILFIIGSLVVSISIMNYLTLWQARNVNGFWPLVKYFALTGPIVGYLCYPAICLVFRYTKEHLDKIWIAQLSLQLASVSGVLLIAWWIFNEIPSKGTLWGGILVLAGVILAVTWR